MNFLLDRILEVAQDTQCTSTASRLEKEEEEQDARKMKPVNGRRIKIRISSNTCDMSSKSRVLQSTTSTAAYVE